MPGKKQNKTKNGTTVENWKKSCSYEGKLSPVPNPDDIRIKFKK